MLSKEFQQKLTVSSTDIVPELEIGPKQAKEGEYYHVRAMLTNQGEEDIEDVEELLNSAGISFLIKEDLIDALSSISGAGPAFFAYFIDAMALAGVKNGLQKEMAYKLAAKTALGTGKLLLEKNLAPDEVISMVASKKGVTLAGLAVLDKNKTKKILEKTINAAIKRSKELGK